MKITTSAALSRRKFLAGTAAIGAATAVSTFPSPAISIPKTLKIGFVTPQTGALALFAEPDEFVLSQFREKLAQGLSINGAKHPIEFIVKDSQSSSNRAASVAEELIFRDEVDIITATSTPDTTNPVADQAELNGVPCLTNDTPWQAHFFGRQGDPRVGFEWTYHFFWGLEDVIGTFSNMWGTLGSNKVVGALWPNDPDGNAWSDPTNGFPGVLTPKGYTIIDTGRYQNLSGDFTAQIAAFKAAGVEIVTGVVVPPDFNTFWTQAAQQGFKPKIASIAKAIEFPQAAAALGDRADGLTTEVWWSPKHPFSSGFTGQSSAELATGYEKATNSTWNMTLGIKHALFEVAIDALSRAQDPTDPASIRDAIRATSYNSVVGPIDFSKGPVPNVAKTPLVGGQWSLAGARPELVIVENSGYPSIPLGGEIRPLS